MSGIAKSVIPLLSEWEKYTGEHPDGDLPGFAMWILAKQEPSTQPASAPSKPFTCPTPAADLDDNAQGPYLIARNHRILRFFSKPVIKDLGFAKDEEFSAIIHVAVMNNPNKKELCRELLIENSTGVEITKRLAQKGFIAETPDPNDRRSALLSITDKGKKLLLQGYDRFAPIHTSFLNALTPEEKHQLVTLLRRINQYHSSRINNPEFGE